MSRGGVDLVPAAEQVADNHVAPPARQPQRHGPFPSRPVVADQTTGYAAVGDILEQQADVIAVEDRTIGQVEPATVLDPHAGQGVPDAVDVETGQSAVSAVAEDYTVVGPAAILGAVARIAVQVVRPDDDVGAVLDQQVVREAGPEGVAHYSHAPAVLDMYV